MSKKIIRVFPRRTNATPTDELAVCRPPDLFDEADEVHISVTFTYDRAIAERWAEEWRHVAPVKIGGVAYNDSSLEFIPGMYIGDGYTITTRGCPRRCWFCGVWKKWPTVNVMPIYDGWNVLDDNLLAAPRPHVEAVFKMLRQYDRKRRVTFTGGLEALSLQDYQVGLLADLRPKPAMFWAYDPGDEFETLKSAADRLLEAGFTRASHRLGCYVLIGYPKDTFELAEKRLRQMLDIGFRPYAMLWKPDDDIKSQEKWRPKPEWKQFQRRWLRPEIIYSAPPQGEKP